jgi:peptide/nickel transport system substrate-binding protein
MTRTDTFVVGTLVVLLAIIAGLVGVPALLPPTPSAQPSLANGPAARPYREGVLGHPVSVSPLTARTQADRDLVALVFSGLVRNGPAGTVVPDLAESWTVDPSGTRYTFKLRSDAFWHDGEPVTSDDVAFTIHTLQDPAYTGPSKGSWDEVSVGTDGPSIVTFTLQTPLSGFLEAASQPIAPSHLLAGIPVQGLADSQFGRQPIGSGPFAVVSLDDSVAELIPAVAVPSSGGSAGQSGPPTDALASQPIPTRPNRPIPYLTGIEFQFFDSPVTLEAAYRTGGLDGASGLPPSTTIELAALSGSRALRYPGSTLTAVLFNLRPGHSTFADPAVRTALLEAIDRPRMIGDVFGTAAVVAPDPIPPSSPLFDATADPPVPHDPSAARAALTAAGWTVSPSGWRPPKAKEPVSIEIISPDQASNPAAFGAAEDVVRDWTGIGLTVSHVGLSPSEFSSGRLTTGDFSVAVADLTVGLDPDLYPLLASSQTVRGGSNVIGLQDQTLDGLLEAARGPGTMDQRAAAYSALQKQLAKGRYLLPLVFADESIVVRDSLTGPTVRQVADPSDRFWDVLTWRLAAGR